MKLVIISGLSGSGKTVALHTLEDEDYYCVDNLPIGLLPQFIDRILSRPVQLYDHIAIGIDARSDAEDLRDFDTILEWIKNRDSKTSIELEIIYLQANLDTLIKRFSDTRRKHPLTKKGLPLSEAIEVERSLLQGVATNANLYIDTTKTNIHELRNLIKERIVKREQSKLSLLFHSFGFKNGAPIDSDFVFDVRCLPNPHWEPNLRALTGQDAEVIAFLQDQKDVREMLDHIKNYLAFVIPKFMAQNRYYITVSIGCTGGQHRSVFIAETLHNEFRDDIENVSIHHRELNK
ncbi:MAG: RNase adapter RapZ [Gammaproteobacteria bacterium]|nr:MAG: RNase adapter RapZ [Gammaproteobacteria bacterium]